jgi:mRNA-degrading endonuclease toxin of MazEF toxin-antitoxin module
VFRRGHLYWARVPGESKQRPVVVLSPDRRNDLAETVVVVPCTTTRRFGPWNVALTVGEGGLDRASVVKCEEISSLLKERLGPTPLGGPLSVARLDEIRDCLLRALDFDRARSSASAGPSSAARASARLAT